MRLLAKTIPAVCASICVAFVFALLFPAAAFAAPDFAPSLPQSGTCIELPLGYGEFGDNAIYIHVPPYPDLTGYAVVFHGSGTYWLSTNAFQRHGNGDVVVLGAPNDYAAGGGTGQGYYFDNSTAGSPDPTLHLTLCDNAATPTPIPTSTLTPMSTPLVTPTPTTSGCFSVVAQVVAGGYGVPESALSSYLGAYAVLVSAGASVTLHSGPYSSGLNQGDAFRVPAYASTFSTQPHTLLVCIVQTDDCFSLASHVVSGGYGLDVSELAPFHDAILHVSVASALVTLHRGPYTVNLSQGGSAVLPPAGVDAYTFSTQSHLLHICPAPPATVVPFTPTPAQDVPCLHYALNPSAVRSFQSSASMSLWTVQNAPAVSLLLTALNGLPYNPPVPLPIYTTGNGLDGYRVPPGTYTVSNPTSNVGLFVMLCEIFPTPTATRTPTLTRTPTATLTASPGPSPTPTFTAIPYPTGGPYPTVTPVVYPTPTAVTPVPNSVSDVLCERDPCYTVTHAFGILLRWSDRMRQFDEPSSCGAVIPTFPVQGLFTLDFSQYSTSFCWFIAQTVTFRGYLRFASAAACVGLLVMYFASVVRRLGDV